MAEIVDQASVLDKIATFRPLWRVFLGTAGTLQSTLTAYFGVPVVVEVTKQADSESTGPSNGASIKPVSRLHREVNLVCKDTGITACRASTELVVEDAAIRRMIVAKELGIGQIIRILGADAQFRLGDVGQDDESFWRTYTLSGSGFRFVIREEFPKDIYTSENQAHVL